MSHNRLLFIQHGLTEGVGHWLTETREWRNAANALNMQWFGVAHKSLHSNIASALDLAAVFTFKPGDIVRTPPLITNLTRFIETSDEFKFLGERYFPADISAKDLLFLPFATEVEVFGVAKWLDSIHPTKRPATAFMFHHLNLSWKIDASTMSVDGDFSTWEYAARAISQRLPSQKIRIFGTGDLLSAELSKIFKIPVHTLPLAYPYPADKLPSYRDKQFDVGILGGARIEQGADKWGDIFKSLAKLRPNLTLAIQVNSQSYEQELRNALEGILPPANIDIHVGPLMTTDYYKRMGNCRLLLLPYMPDRYCFRESGVFIEAACRTVPSVVSELTSMGQHIKSKQAAGVVYKNNDAESIAEATNSALDNIEELYQRSTSLSETLKNKHRAENILRRMQNSFANPIKIRA